MRYILEQNDYWNYRTNVRLFDMLFNDDMVDIIMTRNGITAPWRDLTIKNRISIILTKLDELAIDLEEYKNETASIDEDDNYYDSELEDIDSDELTEMVVMLDDLEKGKYDKKAFSESISKFSNKEKEFNDYIRNITVKKFKI